MNWMQLSVTDSKCIELKGTKFIWIEQNYIESKWTELNWTELNWTKLIEFCLIDLNWSDSVEEKLIWTKN